MIRPLGPVNTSVSEGQIRVSEQARAISSNMVYLANNWNNGGRTRHIDVQSVFLRELKEAGVLVIKWIAGAVNEADIFTKILDQPTFQ